MEPRSSVFVKKARSSVNKGQGKVEVKWPTIVEEHKDVNNDPIFSFSYTH